MIRGVIFIFLLFILALSCNHDSIYKKTERDGWHLIDLKSFEIMTPKDYEFKRQQGVDSFVGEITDGDVIIRFDYGCYTGKGVRDRVEGLAQFKHMLDIRSLISIHNKLEPSDSLRRDTTLLKLMNQSKFDSIELVECINSWDFVNDIGQEIDYCHYVEVGKEKYLIPYVFDHEVIENGNRYRVERDTLNGIYTKLYWERHKSDSMRIGIYISNLNDFNESVNSYCKTVGMYASEVTPPELEIIKEMFKSIELR